MAFSLSLNPLSFIGGIISNKMTNDANAALNRENQRFAMQQATIAFDRQRQLIREQNEYNSYSNQTKLMKEAGINPYNMVSGIGGTAVSSSSTTPNQGSSPSSIPMQGIDPATLGILADTQLKQAQANNLDADTDKKRKESILAENQSALVKSQDDFQKMINDLQDKYGDLEKQIGLNKTDAERAFTEAQTGFTKIATQLSQFDLSQMKPAELANIVSDTLVKDSQKLLTDIQAAKTQQEKDLLIKQFALQCRLVSAQVLAFRAQAANSYAQAAWTNNQTSLWQGNGVLLQGAKAENYGKIRDFNLSVKYRKVYNERFRANILSSMYDAQGREFISSGRSKNASDGHRLFIGAYDMIGNLFHPSIGFSAGFNSSY